MGLAVLPARLLGEMSQLRDAMLAGANIHEIPELSSHADWADEIERKHPEIARLRESGDSADSAEAMDKVLRDEIGLVFAKVLECCGGSARRNRACLRKGAGVLRRLQEYAGRNGAVQEICGCGDGVMFRRLLLERPASGAVTD